MHQIKNNKKPIQQFNYFFFQNDKNKLANKKIYFFVRTIPMCKKHYNIVTHCYNLFTYLKIIRFVFVMENNVSVYLPILVGTKTVLITHLLVRCLKYNPNFYTYAPTIRSLT